jgi:formate dehydrogenase (coenzyme F420) beta subunit
MKTVIPVTDNDVLSATRDFLRSLMEKGVVEAIYVPLEAEGGAVLPALVTDPTMLERANPLAPVMPINGARAVSALTGKHTPAKLAAVLRPCEIRALIELVKLQQANVEGLTLIGVDCAGTFEVNDYAARRKAGAIDWAGYLGGLKSATAAVDGLALRAACQMCVTPVAENCAVHIELLGSDLAAGIPLTVTDDLGASLGLAQTSGGEGATAIGPALEARRQTRAKELAAIRDRMNAEGGLDELFASCIRCHNCMTACPICYCKTCLFKSASFDHAPDHYFNTARRKGATRLLSDTLLFHVTRMNHMSTSCVSCGMCTSACPSDIPVGAIFSAVGEQVQTAFAYTPGRDLAEALPLVTFRESEWTEVGEAK